MARTVAVRRLAPDHGSRFIAPIHTMPIRSSVVSRMCMRLYTGSMAGMRMQKVEAPLQSRWHTSVIMAVTIATPTTLSPTIAINFRMMTSNMPASVMMPKKSTGENKKCSARLPPLPTSAQMAKV